MGGYARRATMLATACKTSFFMVPFGGNSCYTERLTPGWLRPHVMAGPLYRLPEERRPQLEHCRSARADRLRGGVGRGRTDTKSLAYAASLCMAWDSNSVGLR